MFQSFFEKVRWTNDPIEREIDNKAPLETLSSKGKISE